MTSDPSDGERKMYEKLFDYVQKRYDFELQGIKDLDSKAGNLIGYVGIVTSLILGLGTFGLLGNITRIDYFILYFGGVIAFSLSIISSLLATKIRMFEFRPLPAQARDYIIDPGKDRYDELLRTSIAQMTDAFNTNNGINTTKANRIKWSYIFFITGIILILIFAVDYSAFNVKFKPVTPNQNGSNSVSTVDTNTLRRLVSGENITINPSATFNVNNSGYPTPNMPWVEIQYQWLKDNLSAYVIMNKTSMAKDQNITSHAINDWITLLRSRSGNPSAWNISTHYISNDNLTIDPRDPPDIILDLFDEQNVTACSDTYGEADAFHEDNNAQYAKIYTACGSKHLSSESLYTTVLHEFAHLLGLGHARVQNVDLMCGTDMHRKMTCHILPADGAVPSDLDVEALLFIYGNDGFGGYNRVLINRPVYEVK
jgi:hypothetical protein